MAKGQISSKQDRVHAPAITDERFARLQTDPRFLKPNREDTKVIIDDRFKSLLSGGLSDKKKVKIDKYGRQIKRKAIQEEENELKRLYRLEDEEKGGSSSSGSNSSSSEDEEDAEGKERGFIDYARGEGQLESSDENSESEEEDDSESEDEKAGSIIIGSAAARRRENQKLRFEDEEDEGDDIEDLQLGEEDVADLDAQAERTIRREALIAKRNAAATPSRTGDTSRLAVVNMDWDHIRAIDLYKVFSSLVSPAGTKIASSSNGEEKGRSRPSGSSKLDLVKGKVLNVRVYPSNFGLERMAKENIEGPPKDIFKRDEDGKIRQKSRKSLKKSKAKAVEDGDSDDSEIEMFQVDEGGEFDEEALRNYQLERLRYYYAIVTFDSPQSARYIMDEVDGTEMEKTANVFDLSFVPEEMTFPERRASKEDLTDDGWRDEASEVHDGGLYKGVDFTTDALRHSKVQLTWDADDPQRSKITRQLAQQSLTIDQLRDEDFKAYLASDSEDSEGEYDEEEGRSKMRALLGLNGEDGDEMKGDDDAGAMFGKSKSKAFEDGRKSRAKAEGENREMQITFMPGLSEAAERKRNGLTLEVREESTKDKYLRKQREKKEKRRQKGEEVDEDVERGGNDKIGFDDPFFASDNDDVDFEEALAAEQEGRGQREKTAKKSKAMPPKKAAQFQQEVESGEEMNLFSDDDEDGNKAGHFSIKDILKAEKEESGKKSRWAKKKEKKNKTHQSKEKEIQKDFAIDVQDERFQGVFNDHRFSLDPSHPSFIKTNSMAKIMEERRKREKQRRRKDNEPRSNAFESEAKDNGTNLADLVESVKKRSNSEGQQNGQPKKKKVRL